MKLCDENVRGAVVTIIMIHSMRAENEVRQGGNGRALGATSTHHSITEIDSLE